MSDHIDMPPDPAETLPQSGPAPHAATPSGFLENPLIWLAAATGYELDQPADEAILADQARRWTTRIIIVATLMLAVFNASSIQTWATTLPPDWGSQTVDALAEVWTQRLGQLGLDRPRAVVHENYEVAKQVQWHDVLRTFRFRHDKAQPQNQ
jgi:hypothetical protein